ncbi:metal-dependent transcriptional regulator [Methanoculleus sp. FWC-SCC1]|uniref:Metal-dependent transcriptional regulator n=1 Tax=Methanoculleus frigidifontis TaxID=2584085 RepID=A0ABT8M881_9EURY|nr:metal-dependent transcriptional regulator [Methanoculleus sp. FWC-SCC1]MDN7024140.1 metal-dependent transcriptional regulator [Methanoculleus sp. FWC-SCC1]
MHPSTCEDYLEAVLTVTTGTGRPATAEEIAGALETDPDTAGTALSALVRDGYLVRTPEGGIDLTETGRERAATVARKHRVLQCFLTEMLGIDGAAASREACTLEHEISDETIDRLSSYIDCPRPRHPGRRRCGRSTTTLLDFSEGDTVRVTVLAQPGCNRRLLDLGILPGEMVTIRRKLPNQGMVVRAKGCDIAISPEIAASIFVEKSG